MSTYDTTDQDGCDVIETDEKYTGPFAETDKYGNLTGAHYETCNGCSREFLEDTPENARAHRDGCRFEGSDE